MEEIGGEKTPDGNLPNFDTRNSYKEDWPGAEEAPLKPSWAQILGGQVADDEVKKFEEEFKLMVPGEGAVAKICGSDCNDCNEEDISKRPDGDCKRKRRGQSQDESSPLQS